MQAGENKTIVLDFSGSMTVDRASALRDEIAHSMSGGGVSIGLSAVEELDLSCLQVLYAALRTAKEEGRELRFTGKLAPRVASRLRACGFLGKNAERAEDLQSALRLLS